MAAPLPTRRRPRERKAHILAAAAHQFWSAGYHQVSMAGIAAEVGIGASALYRHVGGKQELLLAALDQQLRGLEELLADRDVGIAELAAHSLAHREFGVLWEREAGHLDADTRRALRHRLRALAARVQSDVGDADADPDADLRAWAVLSVVDSPSHHRRIPAPDVALPVLVRAAHAVRTAALPPAEGPVRAPAAGLVPASRRERLLAPAVRLFAERGYPSVALDDIGAAAGIAGPSVYHHFASKIDVLDTALQRGTEALWLGLHGALAEATDPADALERLARDYTSFAVAHPHLISILISEIVHLPAERRRTVRRIQHDYLEEWGRLLRLARPERSGDAAGLTVRAAIALVNGLARIPHLRARPGHAPRTAALAAAVLGS